MQTGSNDYRRSARFFGEHSNILLTAKKRLPLCYSLCICIAVCVLGQFLTTWISVNKVLSCPIAAVLKSSLCVCF